MGIVLPHSWMIIVATKIVINLSGEAKDRSENTKNNHKMVLNFSCAFGWNVCKAF